MISILTLCLLLLLTLVSVTAAQNPQPYSPTELILLNCGESSTMPSENDDRQWDGDAKSKFLATESDHVSSSFPASKQGSVTRVPYMTARITRSKLTYTFPVSPGPKFIRLYFYPDVYSSFDTATSFFSVNANSYTLLSNFSAYLTVAAIIPKTDYIIKEFIVPVLHTQELSIAFTASPSSFAFINGIEIVSMPDNLYTGEAPLVGSKGNSFDFDSSTSLETLYRLNVGGASVPNQDDTGIFRLWFDDSHYIFSGAFGLVHQGIGAVIKYTNSTPKYIAPAVVYQTKRTMGAEPKVNENYNLTWCFSVDSGFRYLLRFHFCETEEFITGEGERPFIIFINNMTADHADVYHWSGGLDIPVYKDYVVNVPRGGAKQSLWVALHPETDTESTYKDAVLNGLEIFKLNNSDGNLAGLNPERLASLPQPEPEPNLHKRGKGRRVMLLVIVIVGAVIGAAFALSLCLVIANRRKKTKNLKDNEAKSSWFPLSGFSSSTSAPTNRSSLPTDLCHRFTIAEMKSATGNFDARNVIGSGGFATVYKGYIESTPIAVKRLDSLSNQGMEDFWAEIKMLSELRHVHLLSLIGYCEDQGEMILVYEYMEHGTLREHLYNTKNTPLSWKKRLEMCIGAARGLQYLHSGAKHTIIHRDVKSSNILLDGNWVAKVSDFGLSRIGPTSASQTHVSTVVKGSIGYVDPEYYRRQQLTIKSDVYSFGVVLFEVLAARPPSVPSLPKEQVSLAEWAKRCYLSGTLDQIIDPYVKKEIAPVSLDKFAEIAHRCLHNQGIERPKMEDVAWGLEFALQLQKTAEETMAGVETESPMLQRGEIIFTDDDLVNSSKESSSQSQTTISSQDITGSALVFSEILNREGR